jgi:hypothetical protein
LKILEKQQTTLEHAKEKKIYIEQKKCRDLDYAQARLKIAASRASSSDSEGTSARLASWCRTTNGFAANGIKLGNAVRFLVTDA